MTGTVLKKLERANGKFDPQQMLALSYVCAIPTPHGWAKPLRRNRTFAQPARGRLGNAARQLAIPGRVFNTFNHTQWSGYRNSFRTAGFGEAHAARDARAIQLGLKLLW